MKIKPLLLISFFVLLSFITLYSFKPSSLPPNEENIGNIIASVVDYDRFSEMCRDPKVIDPKSSTWIPADGRSIKGSALYKLTNVEFAPNLRGRFLRGLNTIYSSGQPDFKIGNADEGDPSSNRRPGDYQADELKSHNHKENSPTAGGNGSFTFGDGQGYTSGGQRGWGSANTDFTGGSETRPKNVSVYYYIKIN